MNAYNLEQRALSAVKNATGEEYPTVRAALLDLAENGTFSEYTGNGWFEDDYHQVHIDELSDLEISRILLKNYK